MSGVIANLLVALLAAALIVAALGDLRTRIIPNWLNGAIALLAIPFWWATGLSLWPEVAIQIAAGLILFLLFALAFRLGAMGGGDVKLVAALGLWLPPGATLKLIVIMSIAGGVLTVAMIARQRLGGRKGAIEVPYGVAIAFAGMWLISERYLYQFG